MLRSASRLLENFALRVGGALPDAVAFAAESFSTVVPMAYFLASASPAYQACCHRSLIR